jgi:hypothetical protein
MKRLALFIILALSAFVPSVLGQTVQAPGGINYGNGNIFVETSGNGAPPDACVGLKRYTQLDAVAGLNLWQCVSGHMVNQGNSTTISGSLSNALQKSGGTMTGTLFTPTLQNLGMVSSSVWGSGTNNLAGYFGSTSNCNGASLPCVGILDPAYASTDRYNLDRGALSGTSMAAAQAMLLDFRSGAMTVVSHNPALRIGSTNGDRNGALFSCTNDAVQNPITGTSQLTTTNSCIALALHQRAPGFSIGNPPVGPSGWSVHKGIAIDTFVSTPGISEGIGIGQTKSGVGDNTGIYTYHFNYGGATAPSDEGNEDGFQGGETNITYAGTSAVNGTGLTQFKVNCTIDCTNPGDGRYLIRTQSAVATGNVTAITNPSGFTPGAMTVDATVTPSTFWGTLSANVVTPQSSTGTTSTAMTFSVAKVGGAGAPTAGDLLCFAGQFHEQAVVTSVSGSGPYSITANLRHAHESGSWVMDGGTCGTYIDLTANDVAPANQKLVSGAGQTLHFPIDVLGATDTHTLIYRFFAFGSPGSWGMASNTGQVVLTTLSVTSMTNTNGMVNFAVSGGVPSWLYNQASITISGASDTAFNGACTSLHISNFNTWSCTQSSSIGHTTASTGNIALNNGAFNLWAGAEVLDVQDYTTSPPSIDGTFTLEPNNVAWSIGDAVEQPHHYATHIRLINGNLNITNPLQVANVGMAWGFGGEGISGGLPYGPASSMGLMSLSNTNGSGIYQGHGGQLTPPNGINFLGPYTAGLSFQFAPDFLGNPVMWVGCPLSGCNDPTYNYDLFSAALNNSTLSHIQTFRPWSGSLTFNFPVHFGQTMDGATYGDNIAFAALTAPVNSGSHAISGGGSLTSSTTYYYTIVATNASGNSLASTEFTVATGSTQNAIRVQWNRVNGATGYTVCRGATSGSEQQFYRNGGGFNGDTYFVDDLGTSVNASGACPGTTNTSRGGIEQASHVGLNSNGTNFQASIKEPATLTANRVVSLPSVDADVTLAPINSPNFGGTPLSVTDLTTCDTNPTMIATEAYVLRCGGSGGSATSLPHVTDGSGATQVAISLPTQIDDGTGNGGAAVAGFGPAPTPSSTTATWHANSTSHRWQQNPANTGETVIPGVPTAGIPAGHSVLMGTSTYDLVDGGAPAPNLGSGTPSLVADSSAGTSPTLTLISGATDRSGWISLVVGSSPNTSAGLVTVQFGGSYTTIPKCDVSPANAAAAALTGTSSPWVAQADATTAQFVIHQGATALTTGTTYMWRYSCSL